MSRRVEFSQTADRHLADIYEYVADRDSPADAERFVSAILDACHQLADFPLRGRARDDLRAGLRTLGFRRSVQILFSVTDEVVEVAAIYYGGQDFESRFPTENENS